MTTVYPQENGSVCMFNLALSPTFVFSYFNSNSLKLPDWCKSVSKKDEDLNFTDTLYKAKAERSSGVLQCRLVRMVWKLSFGASASKSIPNTFNYYYFSLFMWVCPELVTSHCSIHLDPVMICVVFSLQNQNIA